MGVRIVGDYVAKCETYSPPGTGGVTAHQEKAAKQPLKAQTGWSLWTDHPVRAYQRMPSAILFDGTATPPVSGGDYAILTCFKFYFFSSCSRISKSMGFTRW